MFVSHMTKHMESIALAALPSGAGDVEEENRAAHVFHTPHVNSSTLSPTHKLIAKDWQHYRPIRHRRQDVERSDKYNAKRT